MSTQRKELSFEGQKIFIGIDVHLKSWSVTLMSETTQLKKFSQSPDPDALYAHLVKNYPKAEYYSVYEAGFCGFWIHYRFTELGIRNIVVNPADVPKISSDTHTIASYYSLDKKEWHMVRLYRNEYPDQIYLGISSQSPQHGGCTSIIEDITLSHDNVGDFRMGE